MNQKVNGCKDIEENNRNNKENIVSEESTGLMEANKNQNIDQK